jgi:hypothetical protein
MPLNPCYARYFQSIQTKFLEMRGNELRRLRGLQLVLQGKGVSSYPMLGPEKFFFFIVDITAS